MIVGQELTELAVGFLGILDMFYFDYPRDIPI